MSNPTDPTNNNEGHDGFVWSNGLRIVYALALTALIALALSAPAFAGGGVSFGH